MPEASAGPLLLSQGPASSGVPLQQLSFAATDDNAPTGAIGSTLETRLTRYQLPSSLSAGTTAPVPERAWHKQRRHYGGVPRAAPPFGVDDAASAHSGSARSSSFSVSAQSSAAPGSSPASSGPTTAQAPALACGSRHLDTVAEVGRALEVAADAAEPRSWQPPVHAPALHPAPERCVLEVGLECGRPGAEQPLTSRQPERQQGNALLAHAVEAQPRKSADRTATTAAAQLAAVNGRAHVPVEQPASTAVAALPTAGLSSSDVARAGARTQRTRVLRPVDNVQALLQGGESVPTTPFNCDVPSETSMWSRQSPASPCVDGTGIGLGKNLLVRRQRKPMAPSAPDAAGALSPTPDRLRGPTRLRGPGTPRLDGQEDSRPHRRLQIPPRSELTTSLGLFDDLPASRASPVSRRARRSAEAPHSLIRGPALTASALPEDPPVRRQRAPGVPPVNRLERLPYSDATDDLRMLHPPVHRGRAPGAAGLAFRLSSIRLGDDSTAS